MTVELTKTPSFRLDGKRALVTGGGRGLGLAAASALSDAGAHVTLAARTANEIERQLKVLPTADVAGAAWRDYGEIILVEDPEEVVREADRIAAEHVEVLTRNPRWYLERIKNYGALFLGPETNVSYGDKVIGTNHTLPTRKAARRVTEPASVLVG